MYQQFGRRQAASTLKSCTLCGAPLPMPADTARAVESLCATCARPVRLGGPKPDVASLRRVQPVGESIVR